MVVASLLQEIELQWDNFLKYLKNSITNGAKTVFSTDFDVKVLVLTRNKQVFPGSSLPGASEIPPPVWRYQGIERDDILRADEEIINCLVHFYSTELFEEFALILDRYRDSASTKLCCFRKPPEPRFDPGLLRQFIIGFESVSLERKRIRREKNRYDESREPDKLSTLLIELLRASHLHLNLNEAWDEVKEQLQWQYLAPDGATESIAILLDVSYGAFIPMAIEILLFPKGHVIRENRDETFYGKIKRAIETEMRFASVSDLAWDRRIDRESWDKIAGIEQTFSQIVTEIFAKIYLLHFQYLAGYPHNEVIQHGISFVLGIPTKNVRIREGGQENHFVERPPNEFLAFEIGRHQGGFPFSVDIDYPTLLDKDLRYKDVTKFQVEQLLLNLDGFYTIALGEKRRLRNRDAAVSIMTRNMSHNIGSHVLSRLSALDGVKVLQDPEMSTEDYGNHLEDDKKFWTYLQQRMDFLANFVTGGPAWTLDLSFEDILDRFVHQSHLLNNILAFAGIDKDRISFNYEDRIVSIPNGTIGCQALYMFLENVIRNAAKHAYRREIHGSQPLAINLVLRDERPESRYFRLDVADNLDSADDKTIASINRFINDPLIDERGAISKRFWGIKEMKIDAAILRLARIENIDEDVRSLYTNLPLLTADRDGNSLRFSLYLRKPMKALIYKQDISRLRDSVLAYQQHGIAIESDFSRIEFLAASGSIDHHFLIFLDEPPVFSEFAGKYHAVLPLRLMRPETFHAGLREIGCALENQQAPPDVYRTIWQTWIREFETGNLGIYVRNDQLKKSLGGLQGFENILRVLNEQEEIGEAEAKSCDTVVVFDHKRRGFQNCNLIKYGKYYERISGGHEMFRYLERIPEERYLIERLVEVACTNVGVLDKRLWEEGDASMTVGVEDPDDPFEGGIKSVLKRQNIFVLDTDSALSNFEQFVENLPCGFHFLIMHQGEIDDINRKEFKRFDDFWTELKRKVGHVIITTGRGKPDRALKEGLKWVAWSELQEILFAKPATIACKLRLVNLLYSLRGGL
jgi:hypothetical protein